MGNLERAGGPSAADLFGRVSALIEQSRSVVAAQANAALTQMNWEIGHLIDTAVFQEKRAGYAEIMAALSQQDGIVVAEYWTALPPKEELERRIAQIYRAAQERVARRELGPGCDDEDGE